MTAKIKLVAHHEAGHVVMNWLFSGSPRFVSVIGDKRTLGRAHTIAMPNRIIAQLSHTARMYNVYQTVMILVSGGIAERLCLGKQRKIVVGNLPEGSEGDYFAAYDALRVLHGDDSDRIHLDYTQILNFVSDIFAIAGVASVTKALANELIDKKEIFHNDLDRIGCNSASDLADCDVYSYLERIAQ